MIDNIIPTKKWEFDNNVADCFEDMLERSIPQYEIMRKTVFDIASFQLDGKMKFSMLDIGCSNGLSIEYFVKKYGNKGKYIGIDTSEPMLEKARNKFATYIDKDIVSIQKMDLRKDFPKGKYDIITSILCIMFTPIQYRQNIIQNIYNNLSNSGMFIMVEKVIGNTAQIDNIMVDIYYSLKSNNGYTREQIERKKMSLEGVQVPVTSNWNIDLLKQAGFRQVDVFWRWMNFVGYVALK